MVSLVPCLSGIEAQASTGERHRAARGNHPGHGHRRRELRYHPLLLGLPNHPSVKGNRRGYLCYLWEPERAVVRGRHP